MSVFIRPLHSAVKAIACTIDPQSKTLSDALKSLRKNGFLKHSALQSGFEKICGYTNDEKGIRHSLIDQAKADVEQEEAIFMFGACASFAAYLASKHRKMKNTDAKS